MSCIISSTTNNSNNSTNTFFTQYMLFKSFFQISCGVKYKMYTYERHLTSTKNNEGMEIIKGNYEGMEIIK